MADILLRSQRRQTTQPLRAHDSKGPRLEFCAVLLTLMIIRRKELLHKFLPRAEVFAGANKPKKSGVLTIAANRMLGAHVPLSYEPACIGWYSRCRITVRHDMHE